MCGRALSEERSEVPGKQKHGGAVTVGDGKGHKHELAEDLPDPPGRRPGRAP